MSEISTAASPLPQPISRGIDWLKGHGRTLIVAAVGFQLFVLVGMIVFRAAPYWTGQTVMLRIVPVDPRDMFRGDYVTLSYQFSRLSGVPGLARSGYSNDDWQGRTVYVTLLPESDGQHWRAERIGFDRPRGGTFIRGTIAKWDRVECGIESYYVQEGKGHEYEDAVRRGNLYAIVAISPDGRAALRGLQTDRP